MTTTALAERQQRLDWLRERGVRTERRLGEEDLPDDLVRRRREREFDRRVGGARKRVMEQRNTLSDLAVREAALAAALAEHRLGAEAAGRRLHDAAVRRSGRYLSAARLVHPDRAGLVRTLAASRERPDGGFIPAPPSWLGDDRGARLVPDSTRPTAEPGPVPAARPTAHAQDFGQTEAGS